MRQPGNRLDWDKDGAAWPHAATSRFIRSGGFHWHVQVSGKESAPAMVLLHGTGASSHSWRNLIPLLADRFRLIVPDLPCHGFTRPDGVADLSLPGMARALATLFADLSVHPDVIAGHSAGGAIAVALASGPMARPPKRLVAINGAFLPIRGNRLLSPMAKALFANPFSASMFSALSRLTPLGDNLLGSTRSPIDQTGRSLYQRLLSDPGHVRGALGMMASWNLDRMDAMLRKLTIPVTFIAAEDDPMVPPDNSAHAAGLAPGSRLVRIRDGGHLLHECQAETVARVILEAGTTGADKGADAA